VREACLEYVGRYRDAALACLRATGAPTPEHQMLAAMVRLCADGGDGSGSLAPHGSTNQRSQGERTDDAGE
jgi:hypothetical protein